VFTTRYLDRVMAAPLRSPLGMCDALKLRPTKAQLELLERFVALPSTIDVSYDAEKESIRAVAVALVWRVLSVQGSRGLIVTSDDRLGEYAMRFVSSIALEADTALASVTHQRRWNSLSFGSDPGWEVRLLPNNPSWAAEAAPRASFVAVLGFRGSDPAFVETVQALDDARDRSASILARVW